MSEQPSEIKNVLKVSPAQMPRHALVFDSPHSGQFYPDDFNYVCDKKYLQQSEDRYVDELFSDVTEYGAPLLKALFSRAYLDVNRQQFDIDPSMLQNEWPGTLQTSMRGKIGTGLIRYICRPDNPTPVYGGKLSVTHVQSRIKNYYTPYHTALEQLINQTYDEFGLCYHLNCHSMPSRSVHHGGHSKIYQRKDFILGDRDGTSCALDFTQFIKQTLEAMGYTVGINDPYKGVELVRRYSNPSQGLHSIQIEINRSLYMDEANLRKTSGFEPLKRNLNVLVEKIVEYLQRFV